MFYTDRESFWDSGGSLRSMKMTRFSNIKGAIHRWSCNSWGRKKSNKEKRNILEQIDLKIRVEYNRTEYIMGEERRPAA